jgi:serine protease
MNTRLMAAFPLIVLASRLSPAQAALRHVPLDYPSIQAAVDSAVAGDTVLVAPGTYRETVDTRGTPILLLSESGAASTVIDPAYGGPAVWIRDGASVRGFTLRRGAGAWPVGGCVYVTGVGAGVVENIIEDGTGSWGIDASWGGGILVNGGDALIEENWIRNNRAVLSGGGIAVYDAATIRNNRIEGNSCGESWRGMEQGGAGVYLHGAVLLEGNLILGNVAAAGSGAGVFAEFGLEEIRNNTVVGNRGGGIRAEGGTVARNIVASDDAYGILAGCLQVTCNLGWHNAGGNFDLGPSCDPAQGQNIVSDPAFCDPENGDYSLAPSSPANGQVPGCGLIGALPATCADTPVRSSTWGRLKSLYR